MESNICTRQTISACDAQGEFHWGYEDAARKWAAQLGDTLYLLDGTWLLLSFDEAVAGIPGKTVGDEEALVWLVGNGYAPPDELANVAEASRLRQGE